MIDPATPPREPRFWSALWLILAMLAGGVAGIAAVALILLVLLLFQHGG